MRILLLTTDAYGGHGGIALYNRDIVEALAAIPEVVEIVVIPRNQPLPSEKIPDNVTFVSHAVGGKVSYIKAALKYSKRNYDLVICGHINLLPLAVLLNIWLKAPLALMVYGIDVWQRPYRLANQWLAYVDSIWSISSITLKRMNTWAKLTKTPCVILPNAIHLDRYGLAPKSTKLLDKYQLKGRVLMTLARLPSAERYKGVDEILEIMGDLLKEYPDLMYLVVGDGDDRPRLEAKVKALQLEGKVVFSGFIPEAEKADHFRLADVFAMPGRGEGFGFVFLEAIACGVPVVGSRVDGSREALLNGQLGELVDPTNHDSIITGIKRALAKPKAIPDGLPFFAWPSFQNRVAKAVDTLVSK